MSSDRKVVGLQGFQKVFLYHLDHAKLLIRGRILSKEEAEPLMEGLFRLVETVLHCIPPTSREQNAGHEIPEDVRRLTTAEVEVKP